MATEEEYRWAVGILMAQTGNTLATDQNATVVPNQYTHAAMEIVQEYKKQAQRTALIRSSGIGT